MLVQSPDFIVFDIAQTMHMEQSANLLAPQLGGSKADLKNLPRVRFTRRVYSANTPNNHTYWIYNVATVYFNHFFPVQCLILEQYKSSH